MAPTTAAPIERTGHEENNRGRRIRTLPRGIRLASAVAHAAPDSGTYDDQMDLAQELLGIRLRTVAWVVGDPESAGCACT